MKNKVWLSSLLLPWILFSECSSKEKVKIPEPVQIAVDASDICYHWAEENGDQTPERNKDISEGVARDCPEAKRKAAEAYKSFPFDPHLSLALLKLNDIGYFDLSKNEKTKICNQGAELLKNGFFKSQNQDGYFRAFCPQQLKEAK